MNDNNLLKHVFYIQNYTSYIVVISIIKSKKIKPNNCVFLLGRNFTPPNNTIKTIDLTNLTLEYPLAFWKNWRKVYRNKNIIKNIIRDEIQTKYIYYFSLTLQYYVRMFCSHKNCLFYNNIEDGVSAYWTPKARKKYCLKSTFDVFFYSIKIWANHYFTFIPLPIIDYYKYFKKGFKYFYTIGQDGFNGYKNRLVLTQKEMPEIPSKFKDIDYLYAPAALVEKGMIDIEIFIKVIKKLFSIIENKNNENITIYYRFHPATNMHPQNVEKYKNIFNSFERIQFIAIPMGIALENILFHTNATLITDISSLAIYANEFNNNIVSYNNIIIDHESFQKPTFKKEFEMQPEKLKTLLYSKEITKNQ